jgi:hypothetical protein
MENIITSIKNCTVYLSIIMLFACAGMTDADWGAMTAALETINAATPAPSKNTTLSYRITSSTASVNSTINSTR